MLPALFLLVIANCFMTLAWYGHLKFLPHDAPLWQAILFSWAIALFEYSLMIPATKLLAQQGLAVGQSKARFFLFFSGFLKTRIKIGK